MDRIIGIDLGTTASVAAILEGSEPKILTNAVGGRTTPSVVGFTKSGERLVGQVAKHQQITNPSNTIFSIKRFMGRRHNEVGSEEKLVPYKITGGPDELVKVAIGDKEYTPPEISAMILQDLKKTAEDYLGEKIERAIITVPAYFNDAQRKATQEAGQIAGFIVERVLPEPTAAALAYGFNKKKVGKIAVFDLGGGTYDISILDVGEGVFETLSINGDTHLGGDDFDAVLVNYVADEFKKKEGIDLKKDPMAHQRLIEGCEKAKIELSTSLETTINLPFITATNEGPKHLVETLTRNKFEQITDHLLTKLRPPVEKALQDAGVKVQDIAECILVGGSTRIPAVQRICKEIFGKEPNKSVNPDEVVAAGAAIQAAIISGDKGVGEILVLDVTPLSLSVETLGGVSTVMIPRNTTIPTSKKETYSTAADGQTSVTIQVLQGERPMAIDNRTLGRFNLDGIPPAPRGMPQIEVTFDIDTNGILNVNAKDKASGKEQSIKIEGSSGLSKEQIEKMTREAEANAEEDKKKKEGVEVRNHADAILHQAEKSIKEYGEKIGSENISKIENAVNNLKEQVKSDNTEVIKKGMEELSTALQVIGKIMYEEAAKKAQAENPSAVPPGTVSEGFDPMDFLKNATVNPGATDSPGDTVIDADYEVKS